MYDRFAMNSTFTRSIDKAGWALCFVWIGSALLLDLPWPVFLIGAGVIVLSVQAALLAKGERVDIFMSALGLSLLAGALADSGTAWSLIPPFLIIIGLAMFADMLCSRSQATGSSLPTDR